MQPLTKLDDHGVERCQQIKKIAIENVKGDATKGFRYVDAYCNRPMTLNIADKRKICPDCYKEPTVGWVNPRVTNAAGTLLTQAELKECGLTEDPSLKPSPKVKAPRKPKEATKAVEAKVKKETKKDAISIEVDLSTLESTEDVAATFIRKASAALDLLPVTNFAESKRLIKLQEKLESLLKA